MKKPEEPELLSVPFEPGIGKPVSGAKEDLSGRERLAWNVLSSWGGHLIFLLAGFIMPRVIDRHVGQVSLGIWDFSWSLVNYMSFAGLGIGSSVNRYVAKYRAAGDMVGLSTAVSSVMCVQRAIAIFVLLLTVGVTLSLGWFFAARLGAELNTAKHVVALLGASLAVQMGFDSYRGVITGCHRWDIHNGLNAGSYAAAVAGMIAALVMGGGLGHIALVYLIMVSITELIRRQLAFRVCQGIVIRLNNAKWGSIKEMVVFGLKTVTSRMPQFLLVQTNNIMIAGYLGPAALAVFSRPISLVRNVETFVNKFAFVLTPMAGSLQEIGKEEDLREFLMNSSRFGVSLTLPIMLYLAILGGPLLKLWMGDQYAHGVLLMILAAGYCLPLAQSAVITILTGMNLHGRVSALNFIATVMMFVVGVLVIGTVGWELTNAALLVAIPLTVGNGIIFPVYACRKLGIRFSQYVCHILVTPSLCGLGLAVCLAACRSLFEERPVVALVSGLIVGGIVTGILYWRFLLDKELRNKFSVLTKSKLGFKGRDSRIE
jgi:O-antigen/teichoic acid export membrane protein